MTKFAMIASTILLVAGCNGPVPRDDTQRLPENRNFTPQSREPGLTISGHVDVGIVKVL